MVGGLLVIIGGYLQGQRENQRIRQQNEREDRLREEERVRSVNG